MVADTRICYDLARTPGSVEALPVIPDAWIDVERISEGGRISSPLLLEIDRGAMYRLRFKRHVSSRIEFVRGGGYEECFGTKAVLIVYAAAGGRVEEAEARRRSVGTWTMEALGEMGLVRWAGLFRFCALSFGQMYEAAPFGKRVWYVPGEERPGLLFEG